MTEVSQLSQGQGNTKLARIRTRRWVFTLNNYSESEYENMIEYAVSKSQDFCIGKEIGETGTPHLQGYIEFKGQISLKTLKDLNGRAHWEKARGNKVENWKYCSKDGDYKASWEEEELRIIHKLHKWQQDVVDIVSGKPDDRSIYWYWETKGNVGKTALAKYLVVKHNAMVVSGTVADIKYCIASAKKYPNKRS